MIGSPAQTTQAEAWTKRFRRNCVQTLSYNSTMTVATALVTVARFVENAEDGIEEEENE
jgi:hypothetical protein